MTSRLTIALLTLLAVSCALMGWGARGKAAADPGVYQECIGDLCGDALLGYRPAQWRHDSRDGERPVVLALGEVREDAP